jgi:hypothetical protein
MADKVITPAGLNKTEPYLYRGGVHVQYAKDCIESRNEIVSFLDNVGGFKSSGGDFQRAQIAGQSL